MITKRVLLAALFAAVIVATACATAPSQPPGDAAAPDGAKLLNAAPVTITGDALPGYDSQQAVGLPVPTVQALTPTGLTTTISPTTGPAMVVFMSHWCPVCQRQLPELVKAFTSDQWPWHVRLVIVSTAFFGEESVLPADAALLPAQWLSDAGVDLDANVMLDSTDSGIFDAFGMNSLPSFVLVDGDGLVQQQLSGERGSEALIELANTLTP